MDDKKCLKFIDESHRLDADLSLIGMLSLAAQDKERIDPEVVQGIGVQILSYLQKRNLLEHFCFKRSLSHPMDEVTRRLELLRLKLRFKE